MKLLDFLEGAVATAIIHEDELKFGGKIGGDFLNGIIEKLEGWLFVVARDDDGEKFGGFHGLIITY